MLTRLIAATIILPLVNCSEDLIDSTTIANCFKGNQDEYKLDLDFEGYKSHGIHSHMWYGDSYCEFEIATDDSNSSLYDEQD